MSEVSKYRLGDLFAPELGKSRLSELEKNILERLRGAPDKGGGNIGSYGVEVVLVGINSVVLPENTTKEVFTRMTEARKRLAAKAESEGQALATAIRSEAENAAKRIREFARFRADQIRNRGDLEAAPYLAALNEDPALAVYLKELEFLRAGLSKRTTLVLSTSMAGLGLLTPQAPMKAREGKIPGMGADAPSRPSSAATGATP
jgi:membrane protease subunit HflC